MKKIILTTLFLLPTLAFAEMPAFPMSFWGNVTINDTPTPQGTIIRAYYVDVNPNNLAGEITVKEAGVYGYALSIGQKLLIKEGAGKIIFTFQSTTILNNQETRGITEVSYTGFESEKTEKIDMAFKYEVVTPPVTPPIPPTPAPSPSNNGGSRGGGGGPRIVIPTSLPVSGLVLGSSTYNFTLNLSLGSTGNDVTELQNRLTTEGVYTGPITGYFGSLTLAGVKAYQAKYGISQTGFVGPLTLARLNQGGAVLGGQTSSMTIEQMKNLLAQLQAQVAALLLKLNSLSQ